MRKLFARVGFCLVLAVLVWGWMLISDRQSLRRELVRLHIVANSDSPWDQAAKYRVRDAVMESIREDLSRLEDPRAAEEYLRQKLPVLCRAAEQTLEALNLHMPVKITLSEESFDTRIAEDIRLPAGVYETLRIILGEGKGENWWCVAFPGLSAVQELPVFSPELQDTLTGQGEIRFALLDALGRLENIFFPG